MGGRIKQCEVCPDAFCELVCSEVLSERTEDDRDITAEMHFLVSLEAPDNRLNFLKHPHEGEDRRIWADELYGDKDFYDDVTGKGFNHSLAVKAHELEMKFIRDRGIYTKVPRAEAAASGCRVITAKLLDVNKSDDANPNIRSRMVGRELKLDNRLDLFAATPPLEALRMICSICASHQCRGNGKDFRMMSIDVRRAYFYAKTICPVYIEIPKEDWEPGDEDRVARHNFSLYGTRDAAQS